MCIEEIYSIKDELLKESILLSSEDEVRNICHTIDNKRLYIRFSNTSLKNLFLSLCNRPIVNINSSYNRFLEDYSRVGENIIFLGLKNCKDFNILHIIKETNNIII